MPQIMQDTDIMIELRQDIVQQLNLLCIPMDKLNNNSKEHTPNFYDEN